MAGAGFEREAAAVNIKAADEADGDGGGGDSQHGGQNERARRSPSGEQQGQRADNFQPWQEQRENIDQLAGQQVIAKNDERELLWHEQLGYAGDDKEQQQEQARCELETLRHGPVSTAPPAARHSARPPAKSVTWVYPVWRRKSASSSPSSQSLRAQ